LSKSKTNTSKAAASIFYKRGSLEPSKQQSWLRK